MSKKEQILHSFYLMKLIKKQRERDKDALCVF